MTLFSDCRAGSTDADWVQHTVTFEVQAQFPPGDGDNTTGLVLQNVATLHFPNGAVSASAAVEVGDGGSGGPGSQIIQDPCGPGEGEALVVFGTDERDIILKT